MSFAPLSRWLALVLLSTVGACAVPPMRIYPCEHEGTTRACTNSCGQGTQLCKRGSWGACEVAPARLPCKNTCGDGTQLCQNDRLVEACQVLPVQLACKNTCGDGTQLCQNDRLVEACQVAPAQLPCKNTCGDGTQLCQNNQLAAVCEVAPVERDCGGVCGGSQVCADGKWSDCPQPKPAKLIGTIRDFHMTHPDMNRDSIYDPGIVETVLGPDDKPVYAHSGSTVSVTGPDTFAQWYRDVDGVNRAAPIELPLTAGGGQPNLYTYSNTEFFPIDNQLFGNETWQHNYSFTVEIATTFEYNGGETFAFSGDDDVFVFINRMLAIDLGGIHEAMSKSVDLDAEAGSLGISKGGVYPMHIFFAERHPIASDFVVQTTLSKLGVCY